MITSFEQCVAIQQRRKDSKKRGYSKAVRNWMLKAEGDYQTMKAQLPVYWGEKVVEVEDDQ